MTVTRRRALTILPGLVAAGIVAPTVLAGSAAPTAAAASVRPYFGAADWLWDPIPTGPVLDPQSAQMVNFLRTGKHVALMRQFGVTLRGPSGITASTPRYDVAFSQVPAWGPDPFGRDTMPIPTGTPVPPGSDGHLAVADPQTGQVFNLWQARQSRSSWAASWGSKVPLNGDGRETFGSSSTGARLARYAAVVRASEIAARNIPHALFFSTDMAAPAANFRYPAAGSDGANMARVATPIPEGTRVRLDPSVNLAAIPGITAFELVVGTALQRYGAYCGDNGGSRMSFLFEYEAGAAPGPSYAAAGAAFDYFDLVRLPWDKLQVLRSWNGS
ncbi:hypothetical protein GCM10009836_46750 [Pseudonocardia ailaonensis]|uniref:Uncharacterized protein n=1 Tax=Pseudonocardia ailaonensis TaxID=367279 RepID=A0ABN2ND78_9PSEU